MTTREKSIKDAELHISWAMAAASAEEMGKRFGDDDEYTAVEDILWDAETLLLRAFGETPVSIALAGKFARQVVPFYLNGPLRARQLTMLGRGELTEAIVRFGELVELPMEYALPLFDSAVKPFAELRTS